MNLLTVTYIADLDDMIRQSKSINRFLEPCTHWVVINDDFVDFSLWYNSLNQYYTSHTLKLITLNGNQFFKNPLVEYDEKTFGNSKGYKLQQIYKLLISEYMNEDYLVLDSKNFFIKKCSIKDFAYQQCSNITLPDNLTGRFKKLIEKTTKKYSKHIGINSPKHIIQATTPFIIKSSVLKNVELNLFLKWFNNLKNVHQSEFVLYSLLEHQQGMIDLNNPVSKDKVDSILHYNYTKPIKFDYDLTENYVKILGIHKNFLKYADKETINSFYEMQNRLGI